MWSLHLNLAAVNARTILIYNKKNYTDSRRDFLISVTISGINDVLESCGVSVLQDDPENQDLPIADIGDLPNEGHGMKCHVCIKNL